VLHALRCNSHGRLYDNSKLAAANCELPTSVDTNRTKRSDPDKEQLLDKVK